MRRFINLFLLAGLVTLSMACESKLDKCNRIANKVAAEELATCSDDACKKGVEEKAKSMKDLCATAMKDK